MGKVHDAVTNTAVEGRVEQAPRARWSRHLFSVLVATAVVSGAASIALVWWTGAVPQMVFGHDVMVLLEGGWKWKSGIIPHVDYYSPFGALTFLLVALGMDVTGSMVQAIPAATCIVAAVAFPLVIYVSFSRLHPLIALAASVVTMATCVAPHELRFSSEVWSYAAIYNRWGYALLAVALLVITIRPPKPSRWKDWVDGAIVGSSVALLIFLKISYGLLAFGLFFGFLPVRLRKPPYFFAAAVSAVVWFLVFGVLLRWGFSSLLADMRIASHARHGLGLLPLGYWGLTLRKEVLGIAGLALISLLSCYVTKRTSLIWRATENVWLLGGYAGSAAAILMTNSPLGSLSESPVVELCALVFLGEIAADCWLGVVKKRQLTLSATTVVLGAALALLVIAPVTKRNISSLIGAAKFKHAGASLSAAEVFSTGRLRGLEILQFGGDPPLPTPYVGKVLDGLELLTRTGNAEKPVEALEFANPFNVARGVRPSRTAPTCWQLGFVFSPDSAPPTDRVFNGSDVIMWPKQFGDGNQQNLEVIRQLYGTYLDEHYVLAGESQQWQVFVPK